MRVPLARGPGTRTRRILPQLRSLSPREATLLLHWSMGFCVLWGCVDIGALPRRCRFFSLTESGPLKSQEQYKTPRRGASALFPLAHEKPVFVVGSLSLGPRHVFDINERNCGSENKKDLGKGTFRWEITKGVLWLGGKGTTISC